jgi:hypothetical protein
MRCNRIKSALEKLIDMFPRPMVVGVVLALAAVVHFAGTVQAAEQAEPHVILAGETFEWVSSSKPVAATDVPSKTSALLKAKVENQLESGVKVGDLAGKIDGIISSKPNAVLLFLGAADEKAGTKDETVIETLAAAAKKLSDSGVRVFIVPSSASLGAAAGANLAVAAEKAGATFIEPGNLIDRRPFDEAFEAIARAMQEPAKTPVPLKVATPEGGKAPEETSAKTATPFEPAPSAGQTSTTVAATDAGTTSTARVEGGAPTTIYMRSPLTPKQFDPKSRPVSKKHAPKKPAVAN